MIFYCIIIALCIVATAQKRFYKILFVVTSMACLKIIKGGKKVIVFKMKAKKNYRKKQGHRQAYTKVVIKSIEA